MIYVTGDCHADWTRFSIGGFPEQKEMTRDDFVIVCGDFGLWHDTPTEKWWFKWFAHKNFTVLFVDGNHGNFDRLYGNEFEIIDFHGGKAHKISENIYHLMRGYVFELDGKKIFTFGGAKSHDIDDGILDRNDFTSDAEFQDAVNRWRKQNKRFRINHVSWWEQEMPSKEEMEFGLKTLAEHNNEVDYIITHCCPQQIAAIYSNGAFKADELTNYFNTVMNTTKFSKWFFGHYHDDIQIVDKFILLYHQIVRIT